MARQALGAAARNKVVSVRLTVREKEVLDQKYGSPSDAFRQFVNTIMNTYEQEYVAKLQEAKARRESK